MSDPNQEQQALKQQLNLLLSIRSRKKDKAQSALADGQLQLEKIKQKQQQAKQLLIEQRQQDIEAVDNLAVVHQSKAINKGDLNFWLDSEQQLLRHIQQKQVQLNQLEHRLAEQHQHIDALLNARDLANKQYQRLEMMIEHLEQ